MLYMLPLVVARLRCLVELVTAGYAGYLIQVDHYISV